MNKEMVKFVFLVSVLLTFIFGIVEGVEAAGTPVTISGKKLEEKIRMEGTPRRAVKVTSSKPGYTTYRLTAAVRQQVGAIWLDDRFSLQDSFQMIGEIYIGKFSANSLDADGIGLIFHNDPIAKYGNRGAGLGIHKLKNATGLVFDTYENGIKEPMATWAPGQDIADPTTPYTQLWTTDNLGRASRLDRATRLSSAGVTGRWLPIEMKYVNTSSTTGLMHFSYIYGGRTYQHVAQIDVSDGFINFSTLASTGDFFSSHSISIKEISYVPYRSRELVYKDIETDRIVVVDGNESHVGAVNEDFILEPKAPENYEIVSIEGDLTGIYSFDEEISDKDVIVNIRPKTSKFAISAPVDSITRTSATSFGITSIAIANQVANKKIAALTITMPNGVTLEDEPTLEEGWIRNDQFFSDRSETQYVMIDGDSVNNTTKYFTPDQAVTFLKARKFSIAETMATEEVKIEISVNDRPILKRNNPDNNELVTYYEFASNYNKQKKLEKTSFIKASNQANSLDYRGLKGALLTTSDREESQWIQSVATKSLTAAFWTGATNIRDSNDKQVQSKGSLLSEKIYNAETNSFLERYNINNSSDMPFYWVGGPEMGEAIDTQKIDLIRLSLPGMAYVVLGGNGWTNINDNATERSIVKYTDDEQTEDGINASNKQKILIPQPLEVIYKDTNGVTINQGPPFSIENYRINQSVYTVAMVPTIQGYTYKEVQPAGTEFPIVATGTKQSITLVYKPSTSDMTIKYLLKDAGGQVTTRQVVEDLSTKKRKEFDLKKLLIGSKISIGLPSPKEFVGYTREAGYVAKTATTTITNDLVPTENFEVIYYYKPTMSVSVPKNLNFGTRPMRKAVNTYGLNESSEVKDNSIEIINTYETTNNQPSWELYASTSGFYRENTNDKLLAQLFFIHDGQSQTISSSSTKIVKEQTTYTDDIPLINKEDDEGLFVRVENVQSIGKYNATLTIKLQRAP